MSKRKTCTLQDTRAKVVRKPGILSSSVHRWLRNGDEHKEYIHDVGEASIAQKGTRSTEASQLDSEVFSYSGKKRDLGFLVSSSPILSEVEVNHKEPIQGEGEKLNCSDTRGWLGRGTKKHGMIYKEDLENSEAEKHARNNMDKEGKGSVEPVNHHCMEHEEHLKSNERDERTDSSRQVSMRENRTQTNSLESDVEHIEAMEEEIDFLGFTEEEVAKATKKLIAELEGFDHFDDPVSLEAAGDVIPSTYCTSSPAESEEEFDFLGFTEEEVAKATRKVEAKQGFSENHGAKTSSGLGVEQCASFPEKCLQELDFHNFVEDKISEATTRKAELKVPDHGKQTFDKSKHAKQEFHFLELSDENFAGATGEDDKEVEDSDSDCFNENRSSKRVENETPKDCTAVISKKSQQDFDFLGFTEKEVIEASKKMEVELSVLNDFRDSPPERMEREIPQENPSEFSPTLVEVGFSSKQSEILNLKSIESSEEKCLDNCNVEVDRTGPSGIKPCRVELARLDNCEVEKALRTMWTQERIAEFRKRERIQMQRNREIKRHPEKRNENLKSIEHTLEACNRMSPIQLPRNIESCDRVNQHDNTKSTAVIDLTTEESNPKSNECQRRQSTRISHPQDRIQHKITECAADDSEEESSEVDNPRDQDYDPTSNALDDSEEESSENDDPNDLNHKTQQKPTLTMLKGNPLKRTVRQKLAIIDQVHNGETQVKNLPTSKLQKDSIDTKKRKQDSPKGNKEKHGPPRSRGKSMTPRKVRREFPTTPLAKVGPFKCRFSRRCGECSACRRRDDCRKCDYCKDKKKFGGPNRVRQKCRLRQCKIYGMQKSKSGGSNRDRQKFLFSNYAHVPVDAHETAPLRKAPLVDHNDSGVPYRFQTVELVTEDVQQWRDETSQGLSSGDAGAEELGDFSGQVEMPCTESLADGTALLVISPDYAEEEVPEMSYFLISDWDRESQLSQLPSAIPLPEEKPDISLFSCTYSEENPELALSTGNIQENIPEVGPYPVLLAKVPSYTTSEEIRSHERLPDREITNNPTDTDSPFLVENSSAALGIPTLMSFTTDTAVVPPIEISPVVLPENAPVLSPVVISPITATENCATGSPIHISLVADTENPASGSPIHISLVADTENPASGSPIQINSVTEMENPASGSPVNPENLASGSRSPVQISLVADTDNSTSGSPVNPVVTDTENLASGSPIQISDVAAIENSASELPNQISPVAAMVKSPSRSPIQIYCVDDTDTYASESPIQISDVAAIENSASESPIQISPVAAIENSASESPIQINSVVDLENSASESPIHISSVAGTDNFTSRSGYPVQRSPIAAMENSTLRPPAERSPVAATDNSTLRPPAERSPVAAIDNSTLRPSERSPVAATENIKLGPAERSPVAATENSTLRPPAERSPVAATENSTLRPPAERSPVTATDNSTLRPPAERSPVAATDNSTLRPPAERSPVAATDNSTLRPPAERSPVTLQIPSRNLHLSPLVENSDNGLLDHQANPTAIESNTDVPYDQTDVPCALNSLVTQNHVRLPCNQINPAAPESGVRVPSSPFVGVKNQFEVYQDQVNSLHQEHISPGSNIPDLYTSRCFVDTADSDILSDAGSDISVCSEFSVVSDSSDLDDADTENPSREQWKTGPLEEVNLQTFAQPYGSVINCLNSHSCEIDFFKCFFPETLLAHIVEKTNECAKRSVLTKPDDTWYKTNIDEIKAFLGIRVALSVLQVPSYSVIWTSSDIFFMPRLATIMSRQRFESLNKYLCFSDSSQDMDNGQEEHDSLHQVRAVLDTINKKCLDNYMPHCQQAISETMVTRNRLLPFQHDLPVDSAKCKGNVHIWLRVSSVNSYVHQFKVYTGHQTNTASAAVTDLTHTLVQKYHTIYCNKSVSSPMLFKSLLADGIYACGTVSCTKRSFPGKLFHIGEPRKAGCSTVWQKGEVCAAVWMHKEPVYLFTNKSPSRFSCIKLHKKNGQEVQIPCPEAVIDYEKYGGGVEIADQLRLRYPCCRKAKSWRKYLFWFMVDICINNAYICMKESVLHQSLPRTGHPKETTLAQFRMSLATQLIGNFTFRGETPSSKPTGRQVN